MIYALAASLMLLSIIVIAVLIALKSTAFKWVSYFIIPFLLFNIGFSWHTVNDLLGRATERLPEGQFEVLSVFTNKPFVYIVVREEGRDDPTFHKIPDTKQNRNKGAEAKELLKKGIKIQGEFRPGEQTPGFEFYKWNHQAEMPKD